ncbi:hypothetical protein GALMADRAFT_244991 [Galerina marginata CBS 339.88]|uniref:AIG1-type G domain-containing protein n=1 Tax=Galerina marginata (strain CBS 339.88) TaxID=685588 RepID=A0A067T4C7_GALM3|nr:hypothetical protein GALMADRAFT_244991 [Galerina marginata CBS 339.88]
MHVTIRFSHPGDVDLHQLAVLTEKSFEVLQPWHQAENQLVSLQKITQQARVYLRAVHFSVAAAQHGYDVSHDALTITMAIEGNEPKEELDRFAESMILSTQGACVNAEESLKGFRDVRKVLGRLIEEAKTTDEHLEKDIEGHLRALEEGIPVFENLAKIISEYISWWHWMKMSAKTQVDNATQLTVKYGAMRKKSTVKKWAELREDFVKYKEEIERLEDTYPKLFYEMGWVSQEPQREVDLNFLLRHELRPNKQGIGLADTTTEERKRWWKRPLALLREAISYLAHNNEARNESEGVADNTQVRSKSPIIRDCEDLDGASNLRRDDIVIVIMGATGTGKSNLIDTLTGQSGKRVGHGLRSCTTEVSAVRIKGHPQHGSRIVLVDTPGFNDTNKTDLEVLEIISKWLVQLGAGDAGVFLSGILHLRRITDIRLTGRDDRTMAMFTELCGKEAAKIVRFVTTMWDEGESKEISEYREAHLKAKPWSQMLLYGASTARFLNTPESAWEVIETILSRLPTGPIMLELQQEILKSERPLTETKAAQALTK